MTERRFLPCAAGRGRLRFGCALLVALLLGPFGNMQAMALAGEPHELITTVIGRVLAKIEQVDADVLTVFEQELSPHLDFAIITRWLVGDKWTSFGPAEQSELINTVHNHIVRVYASLLVRGRDVAIEIAPNSTVLTRSATVAAHLTTPDGRDIPVEFRLVRSEESWKLYDLVVEGLSFARSLRAELAPVIDAGGVAGLKTYLNQPR